MRILPRLTRRASSKRCCAANFNQGIAMSEAPQPTFAIEKIYLRDLSVEVPNAPEVFLEREAPVVEVNVQSNARAVQDGMYEVVLTITITAKIKTKVQLLEDDALAGVYPYR